MEDIETDRDGRNASHRAPARSRHRDRPPRFCGQRLGTAFDSFAGNAVIRGIRPLSRDSQSAGVLGGSRPPRLVPLAPGYAGDAARLRPLVAEARLAAGAGSAFLPQSARALEFLIDERCLHQARFPFRDTGRATHRSIRRCPDSRIARTSSPCGLRPWPQVSALPAPVPGSRCCATSLRGSGTTFSAGVDAALWAEAFSALNPRTAHPVAKPQSSSAIGGPKNTTGIARRSPSVLNACAMAERMK